MKRLLAVLLLAAAPAPSLAAPIRPCEPWPECSIKPAPVNPGDPKDPSVPGIKETLPPKAQELRGITEPPMPAPPKSQ